jgi:hypothetical protein
MMTSHVSRVGRDATCLDDVPTVAYDGFLELLGPGSKEHPDGVVLIPAELMACVIFLGLAWVMMPWCELMALYGGILRHLGEMRYLRGRLMR